VVGSPRSPRAGALRLKDHCSTGRRARRPAPVALRRARDHGSPVAADGVCTRAPRTAACTRSTGEGDGSELAPGVRTPRHGPGGGGGAVASGCTGRRGISGSVAVPLSSPKPLKPRSRRRCRRNRPSGRRTGPGAAGCCSGSGSKPGMGAGSGSRRARVRVGFRQRVYVRRRVPDRRYGRARWRGAGGSRPSGGRPGTAAGRRVRPGHAAAQAVAAHGERAGEAGLADHPQHGGPETRSRRARRRPGKGQHASSVSRPRSPSAEEGAERSRSVRGDTDVGDRSSSRMSEPWRPRTGWKGSGRRPPLRRARGGIPGCCGTSGATASCRPLAPRGDATPACGPATRMRRPGGRPRPRTPRARTRAPYPAYGPAVPRPVPAGTRHTCPYPCPARTQKGEWPQRPSALRSLPAGGDPDARPASPAGRRVPRLPSFPRFPLVPP